MYALRHTTTASTLIGFSKGRNKWVLIFLHDFLMGSIKIAAFFTTRKTRFVKFKLIGGNKFCQPANTSGLLGVDCMKKNLGRFLFTGWFYSPASFNMRSYIDT